MIEILKSFKGELKKIKKPSKASWINLISPTKKELSKISSVIEIPNHFLSSLRDVDEIPDMEKEEENLFIIARTPQRNESNSEVEYSTIPLGIIILENHLITICFKENDVVNELKKRKISTSKKIQTTLIMLLVSARIYLRYLNEINKKLHLIQEGLKDVARNEDILHISNIQKSLVYFSTSLRGNQFLIERLTKTKVFTRYEHDLELLMR
jgi:magnesium transporter